MTDRTDAAPATSTPSRREALAALAGTMGAAAALGFVRPIAAQEAAKTPVVQTAKFKIGAGKEEEAIRMVSALAAKVEELEPGVLVYQVYRPANDPSSVFFFEVYADDAALAAHSQQPHLAELRTAFQNGVFAPPVEIVKLDRVAGYAR